MSYPIADPAMLRSAALSLRTMAAMLGSGAVRDSGLYYANELIKAAEKIEVQPYTLTGGRDHD